MSKEVRRISQPQPCSGERTHTHTQSTWFLPIPVACFSHLASVSPGEVRGGHWAWWDGTGPGHRLWQLTPSSSSSSSSSPYLHLRAPPPTSKRVLLWQQLGQLPSRLVQRRGQCGGLQTVSPHRRVRKNIFARRISTRQMFLSSETLSTTTCPSRFVGVEPKKNTTNNKQYLFVSRVFLSWYSVCILFFLMPPLCYVT